MLSYEEAPRIFAGVSRVIVDEIHALAEIEARRPAHARPRPPADARPRLRRVGLSATVEDPPALAAWLGEGARVLLADPGPEPDITILATDDPPPWAGQTATYAARGVMDLIRGARTTLVFINTRAQAEVFFQHLWAENDEALPIALHHGSLSREARQKVEAAMVAGQLRAIVATGSLDLGIDWGDVDLVVQVGAPKNVKRLVQRIGRANHRYNAPSRAVLVPANRFEMLECHAALAAVRDHDLDGEPRGPGPLDVLCQHILLTACAGPFDADALFAEVRTAGPYRALSRADFDDCLAYCATGGYALRAYDRWQRLVQKDGRWQLRDPRRARAIRMNVGTIVSTELLSVRLKGRGGAPLGEIEEDFAASLTPGDTFLFGGETVRYESLREMTVEVTRQASLNPKVAVYAGTKLATSTLLSHRVIALLADPAAWTTLPDYMQDWLALQAEVSRLPRPGTLLAETFPRGPLAAPLPLRLRRPQRPPDPRPPPHPPHGDRRPRPDGLRRQRLRAADLGPRRGPRPRRAPRPRRPARRPRGLARRERGDEAHLPHRRHRRRPDREEPARPAQDRPPGHLLLRHPLRHAAQVRPRPPPPPHHPRRGRPRPRRLRPHRGDARPQPRPPRRTSAPPTSPPSPRPSSSRWAGCRSRAAPRPASSPKPPQALLAEAGLAPR